MGRAGIGLEESDGIKWEFIRYFQIMLHFGAHIMNIGKIATDSLFHPTFFWYHNLVDCKDGMNHQKEQGASCILRIALHNGLMLLMFEGKATLFYPLIAHYSSGSSFWVVGNSVNLFL